MIGKVGFFCLLLLLSNAVKAQSPFQVREDPSQYVGQISCTYQLGDQTVTSCGTCAAVDISVIYPRLVHYYPELYSHVVRTAAHVVGSALDANISIQGYTGEAIVCKVDAENDIAYLAVPETVTLRPLPNGRLLFSPFELYTAYGFAEGKHFTVSVGTVGELANYTFEDKILGSFTMHEAIIFSGKVVPGMSGGVIVNRYGQGVGMINSTVESGTGGTFIPWGISGSS